MSEIKKSEIETNLNNLYDFYHIKNSTCSSHKSPAIYFCSDMNCKLGYICSECLIQNPNHFQKHLAYLIPVDDKEKFFKYLKFPVKNVINEISNSKNEKTDINIDEFYNEIKNKIVNLIDKHKIEKGFEIQNLINKYCYSKEHINLAQEFNNKIQKFIQNGNKHEIQTFIKSLENIIREITNEKENLNKKKNLDSDIEIDIESIINKNLKCFYNLNEFMSKNNENIINNENKINENVNIINNNNFNDNFINQNNNFTPNKNENKNNDNNDFNFDFNVFYKTNDDNNKDNGYVKNEIFNSHKKGFSSPKLDKIKEELNENEEIPENNNIKNRLELLKEKISKLTTKVVINNNNNSNNNNNNN